MPRRATNLALLALTAGLVCSGVFGWLAPVDVAWIVFPLHRALGVALAIAVVWKIGIARRSLTRRAPRGDRSIALGAGAAIALVASLVLGIAWSAGGLGPQSFAGYSAMNLHVFAGVALAVLTSLHLVRRWETRPSLARLVSRRSLLRLGVLSAASFALVPLLDAFEPVRRLTGSKHAGSFTANAMPVTTWTFDAIPEIDLAAWHLDVMGRSLSYHDLAALPQREASAVLDCTGGWWSEQRWTGARLGDVLGDVDGREVRITSTTGHSWTFPLEEAREMILATHLGGDPLSAAHGHPVRLVAPGRRGFQWIKWVERIEWS